MPMTDSGFQYEPKLDDEDEIKKIFPVCVDNFFDDPDIIRKLALDLEKERSVDGSWPGLRSAHLHEIDHEFHVTLFLKVLSCYYDLKNDNVSWSACHAQFQHIPAYEKGVDDIRNNGWIHRDVGDEIAGIIYLTPNADINSGTSIFRLKSEYKDSYLPYANNPSKHALYNGNRIIEEDYRKSLKSHNNKFEETMRFGNVYNRLVMYSASEYHRANSFVTNGEDRLTLVFFMRGLKSGNDERVSRYPSTRVRDKENFDDALKTRINYLYHGNNYD